MKAAHFRTLKPEEVEGQVLYMLKAPVNEYRIIPKTRKVKDKETGKVTKEATGEFGSKKYQLGPGDLVRMANLLAGKRIDELAFGGGEGKTVLDSINNMATAEEKRIKRLKRGREASRQSAAGHKPKRRRA